MHKMQILFLMDFNIKEEEFSEKLEAPQSQKPYPITSYSNSLNETQVASFGPSSVVFGGAQGKVVNVQ